MKKLLLAPLALITMGSASAQNSSQPATKPDAGAHLSAGKPILISGRVSGDGQHFSFDRDSNSDSEWNVSNVRALKGHEGSLVTVKCYVDASRNQIQILSVNRVQAEER